MKYNFLREKYESGAIVPVYIHTHEQQADVLTKPPPKALFEKLKTTFGVQQKK